MFRTIKDVGTKTQFTTDILHTSSNETKKILSYLLLIRWVLWLRGVRGGCVVSVRWFEKVRSCFEEILWKWIFESVKRFIDCSSFRWWLLDSIVIEIRLQLSRLRSWKRRTVSTNIDPQRSTFDTFQSSDEVVCEIIDEIDDSDACPIDCESDWMTPNTTGRHFERKLKIKKKKKKKLQVVIGSTKQVTSRGGVDDVLVKLLRQCN